MTKDELLARLEAATADQQRELLLEVFDVLNPEPPRSWRPTPIQQAIVDPELRPAVDRHTAWRRKRESFALMILAEAYESAALTLVPVGWSYEARQGPSGQPHIWDLLTIKTGDVRYTRVTGRAKSAALAIVIAALKAHAHD